MHSKVFFRPIEDSSDDEDPIGSSKLKWHRGSRTKLFGVLAQLSTSQSSTKQVSGTSTKISRSKLENDVTEPAVVSPCSFSSEKSSPSPSKDSSPTLIKSFNENPDDKPVKNSSRLERFRKSYNRSKLRLRESETLDSKSKPLALADIVLEDDDEDPVIALFETRTTQKVRFKLEEEPKERGMKKGRSGSDENLTGNSETIDSVNNISKDVNSGNRGSFNITKFMKNALFGGGSKAVSAEIDEFEKELAREIESVTGDDELGTIVWGCSATSEDNFAAALRASPFIIDRSESRDDPFLSSFEEDRETRASLLKLLNKARRAQFIYFRYQYAVRTYVKAMELLKKANYPDEHPAVVKTLKSLNNAYFSVSSLKNSANIVRLGIKYEDSGELIRALKMYTIAYRIRRDNLSVRHPSLAVLLNMLGSIQIKRGQLQEAMAIYQLALKDSDPSSDLATINEEGFSQIDAESSEQSLSKQYAPIGNFLTRSIAYREMGTIFQEWGDTVKALENFHRSLECMAHYRGISEQYETPTFDTLVKKSIKVKPASYRIDFWADNSPDKPKSTLLNDSLHNDENDATGMELTFSDTSFARHENLSPVRKGFKKTQKPIVVPCSTPSPYDVFFPTNLEGGKKKKKKRDKAPIEEKNGDFADIEIAQTVHRIAQLHRAEERYEVALPVFHAALRGMKYALGKTHPNVAAILGNIGNLQKEMGDMDGAYQTYQQVLAIESYRLGLSHPDVVVTLHNIATIDAGRGNHEHALSLYSQVLSLQRKLFGEDHESVAVTSACMGDVYERVGDSQSALECYEEALRIKISSLGRHSLEVARLLHKLGKLAVAVVDYHLALSYLTKAALVYRLNKLRDDDEWVVDVSRDAADVEASIAMGRGVYFEC